MTDNAKPNSEREPSGKAKGGKAKAAKMTLEERKEAGRKMAQAKKELAALPIAEYGSSDAPLKIGDVEIQCYVLNDGTRVLSQRGMYSGLGWGGSSGGERLLNFIGGERIKPFLNNDILPAIETPIKFRHPGGGGVAFGYPATILADICDAILAARKAGTLQKQQAHVAERAEILVRGFARVGIVALVDEATGYQRDRERDALAKILEAFVAKEIQPYITTFPPEYYEELFRLRGLEYPPSNPKFRPQYFGLLTNDIVYKRLAPNILEELKKKTKSASKGTKLFQSLTPNLGQQKLREHLSSAVTIMKLSNDYPDFIAKMNRIHPRFDDITPLDLEDSDK